MRRQRTLYRTSINLTRNSNTSMNISASSCFTVAALAAIVLLLSSIISGCSSKKKAAELNPPPAWVEKKPVIPGYYVGIGGTRKVGTTPEYTAEARKEALADMVADISSRISTSSVLHSIETNAGLSESFTQRIEIETDDYVEGFEPYDDYETETMYWVYYRIDKTTYHERKAEKKKEAIANAQAKLQAGDNLLAQSRPMEALKPFVEGLTALKNYLGEETQAQYNGKQVDIGSQLYNRIKALHKALDIKSNANDLQFKSGSIVQEPINFSVSYQQQPIAQIPVSFHYTGGYLTNDKVLSNNEGIVSCVLGKISGGGEHALQATIVWEDLLNGSTTDLQVRGLLKSFASIEASTSIKVLKPSIQLVLNKELCKQLNCVMVENQFAAFANQNELRMKEPADYLVNFKASFSQGPSAADFTAVFIEGEHLITDANGHIIKSIKARRLRGVGKSTKAAKYEALEAFIKDANNRYWPELLNEVQ